LAHEQVEVVLPHEHVVLLLLLLLLLPVLAALWLQFLQVQEFGEQEQEPVVGLQVHAIAGDGFEGVLIWGMS